MVGFYTWSRQSRKDLSKLKTLSFVHEKAEEEAASWSGKPIIPAKPQRFWLVVNSPLKYWGTCVSPESMGTKECLVFNQYRLLVQPSPFKIKSERIVTPA